MNSSPSQGIFQSNMAGHLAFHAFAPAYQDAIIEAVRHVNFNTAFIGKTFTIDHEADVCQVHPRIAYRQELHLSWFLQREIERALKSLDWNSVRVYPDEPLEWLDGFAVNNYVEVEVTFTETAIEVDLELVNAHGFLDHLCKLGHVPLPIAPPPARMPISV